MPPRVSVTANSVTISTPEGDAFRQTKKDGAGNPLDGLTLPQALTWIDFNVTDLPSARAALRHLTKLVFILNADSARKR